MGSLLQQLSFAGVISTQGVFGRSCVVNILHQRMLHNRRIHIYFLKIPAIVCSSSYIIAAASIPPSKLSHESFKATFHWIDTLLWAESRLVFQGIQER